MMKRSHEPEEVIQVQHVQKSGVTYFTLFSDANDYAHSCIRTGTKFFPETAAAYDKGNNNRPLQPCYMCVWYECNADYWTYWRNTEHLERYAKADSKDDEDYEIKARHKIKKLQDKAIPEWETAHHLVKPERVAGGDAYAAYCAFYFFPFDEKEAMAMDVEANIEDLPSDECYRCIYHSYRAHFMKQRYMLLDQLVKNYYENLEENGGEDSD